MDLLNNIMESQYFTIGIFGVVAVLAVIFLILLLTGNKKEKIIDKSLINEEVNKDLENEPIVSGPEDVVTYDTSIQSPEIEPVTEFTPEEFVPLENHDMNTNIDMFNSGPVLDNQQPTLDSTPVYEAEPVDSGPLFEPNLNDTNLETSSFVPKQDDLGPPEIVEPESTIDLPKLNQDVEVKQPEFQENEIPMPSAEEPRPFDIENRDL